MARLTVLHVPAKRYLVTTDAEYAAELSDGSALSLEFQGGAMTAAEAAEFAADPARSRRGACCAAPTRPPR